MPTAREFALGARTRPPFVATASAEAISDQVELRWGRKKSCQNVLSGWSRSPIGTTAHDPTGVSIEVASEGPTTIGLVA
jgi:hypothetical protein